MQFILFLDGLLNIKKGERRRGGRRLSLTPLTEVRMGKTVLVFSYPRYVTSLIPNEFPISKKNLSKSNLNFALS